jgi:amino acid adenylation domain-containing protein
LSTPVPLGLAQHEVLQDQRAWPGSRHLLIGGYSLLQGEIDAQLLEAALRDLAAEQPALRLLPALSGQRLLAADEQPVSLWRADFEGTDTDTDTDRQLRRTWAQWLREPWDPATAPPWRAGWLRFGAGRSAILLLAHHSVLDGWGSAQFMRRWSELYSARVDGVAPPATDAEAFVRHLQEDQVYRDGPSHLARDAAFWAAELPALPPPLIRARHATPPGPRCLPAALLHALPLARADYQRWRGLAASAQQTEFATLAAVLAWQFGRLADQDEVLIGVPTLNRSGAAERQALGMQVGVLPLHLRLSAAGTPRELAAQAARQMRQALRHARFPASLLARQLGLARQGRDAAFELLLSFERQDYGLRFGAASVQRTHQLFSGLARYPLSITLCEFGAGHDLELVFEGSDQHFDARALALLARRVVAGAQAFAEQPDAPLASLPLLPAAEREAVLEGLHRDLATQALAPSFIERFSVMATLHPLAVAALWDGGRLDYGELGRAARRLARQLLDAGLQRGQLLPLLLPRGAALLVAMLGAARAGACFVPLDPEWPAERLQALLRQLDARLWLGEADLAALHPGRLVPDATLASPGDAELPPFPAEQDAAYALFTSGSTGVPKLVAVPHGALARRFAWLARVWDLGPADRSLQSTQASFDPALIELLLPLTLGASVALPAPGRVAPQQFAAFAARHGCSFAALVPTTLARLLDGIEALGETERGRLRLRVACCGGEVLTPALAQRWIDLTRAQLWNVYGPTEACIFASAWLCRDGETAAQLPVGSPVDGSRVYVLDAQLQPLPFGTPGEIWLGGPTLALGYLNDAAASSARFVADPFVPGARMYRSGDRGLLDGDGRLQFLGRADRQLKIRGQRVEPGEVEARLLELPGVQEVHVAAVDEPARLHAWLAPAHLSLAELQAAARRRLPEALLPSGWTLLAALPRHASGKLDSQALPRPERAADGARREPANALERELLTQLRAVLQQPQLGVDDDFFASGGDSLAALDWLTAIEQRTGLHADLGLLAQAPSVALLARRLSAPAESGPVLALALGPAPAEAPTLYIAASGHGDRLRFERLAEALAPQVRVQMLQPPPGLAVQDIAELAARYGRHIEAQRGAGAPVWLAGFSVGGVTALETARWLQAQGVAVSELLLIDSVYPRWLFRRPSLWRLLGWLTRSLTVQELSMNGRRLGAMFKDAALVGQVLALHRHRIQAYDGPVRLLRSSGLARWQGLCFGPWRKRLRLQEEEVEGLHGSVFEPGRVHGLAQCLRRALRLEAPARP